MKRIILIAVTLMVVGGCVTIQDHYGSGPVELSQKVKTGFEKYKALKKPTFFAISTDGRTYGYSMCKGDNCSPDWEYPIDIAKFSCEKNSNGVPCKIYARGIKVVWKNYN